MKEKNSNAHHANFSKNINWNEVQQQYDSGLSLRDIGKLFNVEQGVLRGAINRGVFKVRSTHEGLLLAISQGKGKMSDEALISSSELARKRIIKRYEEGWLPKAGRCKKYVHTSPIAGIIHLDGTWELAVAKWLDSKQYNWKRNTKRFQYINLKNSISHYTPDFWVEELGGYLEVKGYETALDRCKWSQFTEPLLIWKNKELKEHGVLP